MSVVDVVLIILMIIFAISGYRQGFLIGVLSFAGFFVGALIGLQVGPLLAEHFTSPTIRIVIALIAVFGLAILGQAATGWLGSKLRGGITNSSFQTVDDLGGAVVSVVAVAIVAWLVAIPLGKSDSDWLSSSVRNSVVLGGIDKLMPNDASKLTQALQETIDTNGFPDVFGDLVPTRARPVPEPDSALAKSQVVVNSHKSVVKVLGSAPSCSRRIEGSGFVYAPEHVLTNAHVVAGTTAVAIKDEEGDRHSARVVVYDPERDLAVLYVPGFSAPALRLADDEVDTGADAIVLGYPLDGPYNAQPARVRDVGDITGPDIYDDQKVTREVYTIRALVRSGNSGGPLISPNGRVLGVIFAAAADDKNTGFAVTADEATPIAAAGATKTTGVGTQTCA
ncbi:MAG: MarP family serine protease [Hamadaea sp.]|uniref:MarP family serine protease n=1 Tax=Hamadaea sp. TaxID=2024425 RepID=UPI0018277E47|nr:MarP family serine protease [Hamadaea sp.]NUR73220.1 MarP family serine protease [Hamadaea sp.]NUT19469.1 MarP family serine protease [Hamadaea sp.]